MERFCRFGKILRRACHVQIVETVANFQPFSRQIVLRLTFGIENMQKLSFGMHQAQNFNTINYSCFRQIFVKLYGQTRLHHKAGSSGKLLPKITRV